MNELRLALLCIALLASVGALGAMGAALLGSPVWTWDGPARMAFAAGVGLITVLIIVWREA